jgi:hypothetical protein
MSRKTSESTQQSDVLAVVRGTCGNCAHWEGNSEGTAGFCLRFPPVVIVDDEEACTVWPITESTERCGEHVGSQ